MPNKVEKHWSLYHGTEKFAPKQDGLYSIYVETPHGWSPYEIVKLSKLDYYRQHTNCHRVVKVVGNDWYVWQENWHCFSIILRTVEQLEKFFGRRIYLWTGPHTVYRECFGCDKPIFPEFLGDDTEPEDKEHRLIFQTSSGISMSDCGNYGSQVHDSMGEEWLHFVICDDCIIRKADKIVEYDGGQYENRTNFRTKRQSHERYVEYLKQEIKLLEEAGYEWREYTKDGQIATKPEDIDGNGCGWFHKDWKPTTDPTLKTVYEDGSWSYKIHMEIFAQRSQFPKDIDDKLDALRVSICHPDETKEELDAKRHRHDMESLGCKTEEEYEAKVKELMNSLEKNIKSKGGL